MSNLLRLFRENCTIYLVGATNRKRVQKHNGTWMTVSWTMLDGERPYFLLGCSASERADNKSNRDGALHLIVGRHHGRLKDIRMTLEKFFDLSRINVFASANKHVISATDEVEETIGISPHYVSGSIPTVANLLCADARKVQIALENRRCPCLECAFIRRRATNETPLDAWKRVTEC